MTASPHSNVPRFECIEGESFNSVIARWAAEAHIERLMDITRAAGVQQGHRQNASSAERHAIASMAIEMGIDPDELLRRSMPAVEREGTNKSYRAFLGLNLPTTLIEMRARRYAPAAFADSPHAYHRALWDLRLIPICIETGQVLIDRCQNKACIGAKLSWRRTLGIDRCEHCAQELGSCTAPVVSDKLREAVTKIASLFVPSQRSATLRMLPPELAVDNGQLALDLLLRLLPVVNHNLNADKRGLQYADAFELCEALSQCWTILCGWPDSFFAFALARRARWKHGHRDSNAGQTARFLKLGNAFTSPSLTQVILRTRDAIDLDGPRAAAVVQQTMRISEVTKSLGLGTTEVARLRREGTLKSRLVLMAGRFEPAFDRAEIEAIQIGIANRIGFGRLRLRFGISHPGIEQIAALGLMDVLRHPYFAKRYGMLQSTRQAVAQFEGSLIARSLPSPPTGSVVLKEAMKAVGGIKPWGPAFEAMLNGEMPFHLASGKAPLVQRVQIAKPEIPKLLAMKFVDPQGHGIAFSTTISKQDATEILNLNPRQVIRLFAGIPSRKRTGPKALQLDHVVEIAAQCITSREIAGRLGMSCQKVQAHAARVGIPSLGIAGYCRRAAEAHFFASAERSSHKVRCEEDMARARSADGGGRLPDQ